MASPSSVLKFPNNSRKRAALLTDTFFNSRGCPLTRELTVLYLLDFYNFCHKNCLVKVFSLKSNCDPLLSKT